MTAEEITDLVMELATLRYFPAEPAARLAIIRMIGEMANDDDQIRWLIRRMTSGIYQEWPGIAEMRGCFCHTYKPKDGINAYSTVYPDGLPPDPAAPSNRIAAPVLKALPPGHAVTADAELDADVQGLAERLKMPPARAAVDRFARMLRDIETPPHERQEERRVSLNFKPYTQEDIDRAREEHLRKRGQEGA